MPRVNCPAYLCLTMKSYSEYSIDKKESKRFLRAKILSVTLDLIMRLTLQRFDEFVTKVRSSEVFKLDTHKN